MKLILLIISLIYFLIANTCLWSQEVGKEAEPANRTEVSAETIDKMTTKELLHSSGQNETVRSILNQEKQERVSWKNYVQMFLVLFFILFLILVMFYLSRMKWQKKIFKNNTVEVLSRSSVMPKQTFLFLKAGAKILLVNYTNDGHMTTLAEYQTQEEIQSIADLVQSKNADLIFDSLLSKSKSLYDEESKEQEAEIDKLEKQIDRIEQSEVK